jgi:23S rRNA pseudouridine2605 synthase
MAQERLQKLLAQAGVASRRAAEKMISEGRVRVNGQVVRELGAKADLATDEIEVGGFGKLKREPLVYIALHKPAKVVSTVSDPEGRTTVLDVINESRAVGKRRFEGELPRVYPVGRLDFDAEGLLLLTNDGELTNKLTHPRHHVPKTYMVKVRGHPDEKALERLRRGVRLRNDDGTLSSKPTGPAEVRLVKTGASNSWLELTIFEGKNHQVKRMCEAVGHFANRLVRIDFGGIPLDPLPAGAWRFLTPDELGRLRRWSTEGRGGKARETRSNPR